MNVKMQHIYANNIKYGVFCIGIKNLNYENICKIKRFNPT